MTDNYYDGIGTVTYWWSHCMISDATYKAFLKSCNFSADKVSEDCNNIYRYASNHEFGAIDQYSIYTPKCLHKPNTSTHTVPGRFQNTLLRRRPSGYDPCTENYAEKYYNLAEVQRALHANVTALPYRWTACWLAHFLNPKLGSYPTIFDQEKV